MLCLLIKEKSNSCIFRAKHRVYYDLYNTDFGEICIYRLYYTKNPKNYEHRLKSLVPYNIYTPESSIPKEYLQKAALLNLLKRLRENPNKTVCINCPHITEEELTEICALAKTVYFVDSELPSFTQNIYRKTGVMPILSSHTANADFYNESFSLFKVDLPEELTAICPKEFSYNLFAGLLYKENGRLII